MYMYMHIYLNIGNDFRIGAQDLSLEIEERKRAHIALIALINAKVHNLPELYMNIYIYIHISISISRYIFAPKNMFMYRYTCTYAYIKICIHVYIYKKKGSYSFNCTD
jgi:hypothetical protein